MKHGQLCIIHSHKTCSIQVNGCRFMTSYVYIMWFVGGAGYEKFSDDISLMLGHAPNLYWKMCWKYVAPLAIIVSVVFL